MRTAQESVILADRNFLGLNLQLQTPSPGPGPGQNVSLAYQTGKYSSGLAPAPSHARVFHPQTILHHCLTKLQLTPGLTLIYSALGPLRFDFILASSPLHSTDVAERCRESSCIFAHLCWAVLSSWCCGCSQQGPTAAVGRGAAAFGCSGVCLPQPCCLQGSHRPRSKQASERLKGIEKESCRTSSEVFLQHKYLYSSDVGFTSTHSTQAGRACKYEQGLYVLTTCSCLHLSLWLSLLCYLLFFVRLNQGNVVSGKRAS